MSVRLPLRVITHNIRYAISTTLKDEKPWPERFPRILNQLAYHTRYLDHDESAGASFICLQEVLHSQLHDVLSGLNDVHSSVNPEHPPGGTHWAHIGVGREDGQQEGEYSPILYPVRLFKLLNFQSCWLSPTPHKPSKGWDAGSQRILTTGVFEHKAKKQRIAVFNTHLDNIGSEAREKSVAIILEVIGCVHSRWASDRSADAAGGEAILLNYILTGDFNSLPIQEAYRAIAASGKMIDTHEAISAERRYGEELTFTGFQPDTDVNKEEKGRIDFIWFGPKSAVQSTEDPSSARVPLWRIEGYAVLPNVFEDGVFCSDHRAVVADAVLWV